MCYTWLFVRITCKNKYFGKILDYNNYFLGRYGPRGLNLNAYSDLRREIWRPVL